MQPDYGNVAGEVFIAAAYVVSLASLLIYAAVQWKARLDAIRALKEEGFLDDR
jgi:hypothetical protein